MSDLALDLDQNSSTYGDLIFTSNDLVLIDSTSAILQDIITRLRLYFGEWFLDNTVGIDYFGQIFVKNAPQSTIDAILINEICSVPGVTSLTQYSFTPIYNSRVMNLSFKVETTDGIIDYTGTFTRQQQQGTT